MLKGRKACSYPSFEDKLDGADIVREPAVTDGHITTGRGMGTAIPLGPQTQNAVTNTKNTGNMRMRVLYCVNDCKCLFSYEKDTILHIQGGRK